MAVSESDLTGFKKGRVPREVRERQIISVAEQVFARHGYDGASLEEVAREAGIDRALLYQYFGGKPGLHDACIAAALDGLQSRVLAALAQVKPAAGNDARLDFARAGIYAFWGFVAERGDAWDVLFRAGHHQGAPPVGAAVVKPDMLSFTVTLITNDVGEVPRESVEAAAAGLLGASWAMSLWWRAAGDISLDAIVEHHVAFCMAAIEPLRALASNG